MEEMKYILFKQLTQTFLGRAGEIKDKERVEGIPFTLAELWKFYVLTNSTDYLVDLIA